MCTMNIAEKSWRRKILREELETSKAVVKLDVDHYYKRICYHEQMRQINEKILEEYGE